MATACPCMLCNKHIEALEVTLNNGCSPKNMATTSVGIVIHCVAGIDNNTVRAGLLKSESPLLRIVFSLWSAEHTVYTCSAWL